VLKFIDRFKQSISSSKPAHFTCVSFQHVQPLPQVTRHCALC